MRIFFLSEILSGREMSFLYIYSVFTEAGLNRRRVCNRARGQPNARKVGLSFILSRLRREENVIYNIRVYTCMRRMRVCEIIA